MGHGVGAWTALALVLALLPVLAACGDDERSSSSTTTAAQTSGGNPATGSPLRIGVLVNVTGRGTNGEDNAPKVLDAWAKTVNGEGGVAGHRVEFVYEDTKGDAPTAAAAAKRITGDKDVVAVILFDANTESVYADSITKAGLPVIGGMGYVPTAWAKQPNWLSLTTTFPSVVNMAMVMAKELGSKTTMAAICAEYPTCGASEPLMKSATTLQGMDFAGSLKVAASAPDYTAECLAIKSKNVDYVALAVESATAMKLVANCKTQGYTGNWGIFDGAIFAKSMRENDPGVKLSVGLTSFPWFVDDAPVAAYRDMMEAAGLPEDVWADPKSTAAYATAALLKKTLDGAADSLPEQPAAKDVIAAYGTVKDETLDGLLPQPVSFTPNKAEPPVNCYWVASFENGDFVDADLTTPVCDPPALSQP